MVADHVHSRFLGRLIVVGVGMLLVASTADAAANGPSVSIDLGTGGPKQIAVVLQILILLTVLSLAPALFIMVTSFTRIVIVLAFLRQALDGLLRRSIEPVPQPEDGVVYAHKLGREEGALDWRRPATELERKVRGFHPWPGTWFEVAGERIKVHAAALALASGKPGTVSIGRDGFPVVACSVGGLKLLTLQRAGKTAQPADSFLRGFALGSGTVLESPAAASLPA